MGECKYGNKTTEGEDAEGKYATRRDGPRTAMIGIRKQNKFHCMIQLCRLYTRKKKASRQANNNSNNKNVQALTDHRVTEPSRVEPMKN